MHDTSWFFARGGQQQGPTDLQTLRDMLASGQLTSWDLVWREGMADWLPASQVPELADVLRQGEAGGPTAGGPIPVAAPAPAPPPPSYPPPPTGYPPHQQPAAPQAYGSPTTGYSGNPGQSYAGEAQTALILSIVGFCCVGIILGPVGIILAVQARRKMRQSGNLDGDGMAVAAIVVGSIVTGLNVLVTLLYVIAGLANV